MKLVIHPRTGLQLTALKNSPAGSVIFHGPSGIGKHAAAIHLAMELNCLDDTTGLCANCRRIKAGNFPDLITITREDKPSIAVDQIRKLISDLSLTAAQSATKRVVIIDEAQTLTLEAQNALLKLLEEPPAATLIILLTQRFDALIPTIRSRCRQILFVPPGAEAVAAYLRNEAHLDEAGASKLAVTAGGLPGLALQLRSDPAAADALTQLQNWATATLSKNTFDRLLLAAKLVSTNSDLNTFGQTLQHEISERLTSGALDGPAAADHLAALETFRRHLAAKVAPRVALERLMLVIG